MNPSAILPRRLDDPKDPASSDLATREEMYDRIEKDAQLNGVFLLLVLLSTVVAALGLAQDNVAVIIGSMMIAPLLGPNLSLALGVALGDTQLLRKSLITNAVGITATIGIATVIGVLWPVALTSRELLLRSEVGIESVVLALTAGAAAVLSITTRLPTVLVGVVVAAAFLPPAAATGLFIGAGEWGLAYGAVMLLSVNIVCVTLVAQIVFLLRGIRPRTWLAQRKAQQSVKINIVVWVLLLGLLMAVIALYQI